MKILTYLIIGLSFGVISTTANATELTNENLKTLYNEAIDAQHNCAAQGAELTKVHNKLVIEYNDILEASDKLAEENLKMFEFSKFGFAALQKRHLQDLEKIRVLEETVEALEENSYGI
jgi:hypothetical protein